MSRFNTILYAGAVASFLVLTGCGGDDGDARTGAEQFTPDWVLASAPDGAKNVAELKASAKEGEQVVLRGRIGGRKEPIAADSLVFTVMDLSIPHCGENPDDECRMPWDYCCETPETIAANSATIQIVDADGQANSTSPMAHGFAALDEVIVIGTVAPRPAPEVLTIRATGLFRVGG